MERQRQRPRRHVLALRKISFAVAELLSVEGLQVDRREVCTAPDAAAVQVPDDVVAVSLAVFVAQANDEYEAADVGLARRLLQDQPLVGFQPLEVPLRDLFAALQKVVPRSVSSSWIAAP